MISFADKVCRICGKTKKDGVKFLPDRRMCNECISKQQKEAYHRRLSGSPALSQGAGCRWEQFPKDPAFQVIKKHWQDEVIRISREMLLIKKAGFRPERAEYLEVETVLTKPDLKARQLRLEIEQWNKQFEP